MFYELKNTKTTKAFNVNLTKPIYCLINLYFNTLLNRVSFVMKSLKKVLAMANFVISRNKIFVYNTTFLVIFEKTDPICLFRDTDVVYLKFSTKILYMTYSLI